jgi:ABC-type nitrate/sulfonate/bicarbonate transport system substrate-binding protein
VHRGFLQLVVQPDVARVAGLRHRRVAVDTDTGYASALFEILARHGLEREGDFDVVYAGATNLRYEKLRRGEFEGTLLGAPFTVQAHRRGYRPLVSVPEALGGYQAVVLVAARAWLDAHSEQARAVTDCLLETIHWASDPANRAGVAALLADLLGGQASAEEVGEVAEALFGTSSEFLPERMDAPRGHGRRSRSLQRGAPEGSIAHHGRFARGCSMPDRTVDLVGSPRTLDRSEMRKRRRRHLRCLPFGA